MSKRRWANVRELLTSALDLTGAKVVRKRPIAELTPSWLALRNRIRDPHARARQSRFFTYASAKGITPDQADDRTIADFDETLKRNSLLEGQTRIIRDLIRDWNRCAETIEGWPGRLTVLNRKRDYALSATAYPSSFGADLEAYLDHLAHGDLFGGTGRGQASPVTVRELRSSLLRMAAALVKSGRDPETIRSLADLIQPEALKTALNFFWKRNGNRKTGHLHNLALTAIKIAKWWVKAPAEQIAELQAIGHAVNPKEKGLTARNRARLRQFDDPENVRRLIDLSLAIVRGLPRQGQPSYVQALRVQSALAISILLAAPMRPKNLASLRLGEHVIQTRPGGVRHIVVSSKEVKNKTPLAFVVSDALGEVMDVYLARCRPLLAGDPDGFLFPARKGGAKPPGHFAEQIRRMLRQETGIDLNAHCYRHLAARLFLREHPGEYETIRLLLGHKDLSTTTQYYCGLEQADALRRYDALIDRYRKKETD
jgi:integrase